MARRDRTPTLRKDRTGANPVAVGAIVLAVITALTWLGFTKDNPFHQPFRMQAVVESAVSIRTGSPVRIAGVEVGRVVGSRRHANTEASEIVLEIADKGLPIHTDAELKIRPRIFLEGNFFVDLRPGSPSAPVLGDGDTLPITRTSVPVQFDEILTALQSDTRRDLRRALAGLGEGLSGTPSAAQDRDADPDTRGETAAISLRDALATGPAALRGTSLVNDALLGTAPRDLSRLIAGLGTTMAGLGRDEARLQAFVTEFRRTVTATAAESEGLRGTIRELEPMLRRTDGALDALRAAFPPTRRLARDFLPGVRETPATIAASFPWLEQSRRLMGPTELRGLTRELQPATSDLSGVVEAGIRLFPEAELAAKCATRIVLPTGDVKIDNGAHSLGVENYKGFWYTMVGLAGESQNFDANGSYVRFQPAGGARQISVGPSSVTGATLFGNAIVEPLGTRPAYPGKRPPYRPDVPCFKNKPPDLNGATTGPPDGGRR